METMYERIKRMTEDEMRNFVYWVYLNGNEDGKLHCCDSETGYFGGYMLTKLVHEVMPHDSIDDLWDNFERIFGK